MDDWRMGEFGTAPDQDVAKAPRNRKQEILSAREDYRSQFYKHYRKEAEDYDREFMEKHDEDLNTTLIFVSFRRCSGVRMLTRSQAGLFSAVTSAFIIDVQSQLRPDPNDETVALLRVLIYKVDNTTFGNDPPALPQWTGPPHMVVQVQAILYASLAASLLSALLAMLGKQWLNRYVSTDLRGTAVERSQNRQRKLDGIITWYFDYVMEALPLMLQAALLLLGCALSRYLWEVNPTVASVILTVTAFGIFFYIFIIAAGAASENCPYQTPGSQALRYLRRRVQRVFFLAASVVVSTFRRSEVFKTVVNNFEQYHPWWSGDNIKPFLKVTALEIPRAFATDAYRLGRATVRLFSTLRHLGPAMATLSVSLARKAHNRLRGVPSTPGQGLDQRTTTLDFRCISWILQTSLDKAVHLLTLKHLVTTPTLASVNPTLVADCFDVFIGCIKGVDNHKVVIAQGLEELATVSALCFFNLVSHLLVVDPTSSILEGARQRCLEVLPAYAYFNGHEPYYTMNTACCLLVPKWRLLYFQWSDYKPSTNEHSMVAKSLVKFARFEYQGAPQAKVPRLILRFALHSLSLYPPPPTSIIADCLSIVAIDLGCDVPDTGAMTSDERWVCI